VDFELDDEQRAWVAEVRQFLEENVTPALRAEMAEHGLEYQGGELTAFRRKIGEKGWFGLNWPKEYGGLGLTAMHQHLLMSVFEYARVPGPDLTVTSVAPMIMRHGTEQNKKEFLPGIARGEIVFALGYSEPNAGTDLASLRTRAVRDGDDYVIDGTKHFISNADKADFVILFAATGTEETSHGTKKRISGFLVDVDTPGLTVQPGPSSVSHRGYHHSELAFERCRVPASQLLGEEGRGFELMGEWLGASRLTVAASSVGRAQRVMEMATSWAAERQQFGQPIGKFQGVSFPLADMATELDAAELLTLRAAWKLDQGTMTDQDAAMAKLFASEALGRITDQALQIFGGMGLMDELPIERFWRDARVERIWDGTSEIQRHIISRSLLRRHGA
jgi:acyl-CoA dehydrogenase